MSDEQDDGQRASVGGPSPEAIRRRAEDLIQRGTARLGFVIRSDSFAEAVYGSPISRERVFAEAERQLRAEAGAPTRPRPRAIPDVPGAYREAIKTMKRERVKLTWQNTATTMRDSAKLDTLDSKTLRGWIAQEGLPKPWEPQPPE